MKRFLLWCSWILAAGSFHHCSMYGLLEQAAVPGPLGHDHPSQVGVRLGFTMAICRFIFISYLACLDHFPVKKP